ncbi:unnamed protein product [Arctogadus glacialis]
MGNKSGKTEITGSAKVMLEKHGEAALEGLKYWCKLGFPEMGSFSLKRLKELEKRLLELEMKKKSSKLCWCAFYLWEREGQDREKNQPGTESVESIGILNLNVTRDIDPDLDCTGGPRASPPSPPPYDNAHEAASSDNLYPDPEEEEKAPARSAREDRPATRSQRKAPQSFQQATATPTKREPVASRLRNQGMAFSPTPQHGDVMDGQFPMIGVLNPQDGSPAYVFRAWRPSDIKDIAEWLPDPSAVGGAAFATALQKLVQQHKASISEVRQLCTYSQGDMPGRDEAKKLQLAQLEALDNPKPTRRNRDQRGDRPKEKRKENAGRWHCHYCGAKDHWVKDCPKRK